MAIIEYSSTVKDLARELIIETALFDFEWLFEHYFMP